MKVLMVCLGNICRSPLAQGILEQKVRALGLSWDVDSAGTGRYHVGQRPDQRSIEKAMEYGINISHQKSRQIELEDLDKFDLILTMDTSNYQNVMALAKDKSQQDKIKLILNYVYPERNMVVPDPYYDGGFQKVYDLLDEAMDKLISATHVSA